MSSRGTSQEPPEYRETPFAGYGDRVGSGVALAPNRWKGGEPVTDPAMVTKSIKPRRMFYSPIGDGVVAADGVELKRLPPDLTPRVQVIQQRIVEKGDPGKAGLRVVDKRWTTGGGDSNTVSGYGSDFSPSTGPIGDGRSSVGASTPAPPFSSLGDQFPQVGAHPPAADAGGPKGAQNGPSGPAGPSSNFKGLADLVKPPADAGRGGPGGAGGGDPYGLGDRGDPYSSRSTPLDRMKSPTNGYGPPSGRTSTTSAGLYEPGYRYEIKKDYQITNPKELIHQYATTTPVTTIDPTIEETTTRTITKQKYTHTVEETFGPYPPYTATSSPSPLKFVRELRDETLTGSQRQANQNVQPANPRDSQYEHRINEIRSQTSRVSPNPEVDQLTNRLVTSLQSSPRQY